MIIAPLLALAPIGALIGGQINRAIYQWAWNVRQISPWSKKPEKVADRTWADCIPIVGWWGMRRETQIHGKGFWVRPMMIELCWLVGLPLFYIWSVSGGQLEAPPPPGFGGAMIGRFVAQTVLLALMTIATFIDFDEKTIPDFITVPGTVFALLFAWLFPDAALLPEKFPPVALLAWKPWPTAFLSPRSLMAFLISIGCLLGWCIALLPRTVYFRRGLFFGLKLLFCGIFHKRNKMTTTLIGFMFLVHAVLLFLAWQFGPVVPMGMARWEALMSALIGIAIAGGFVWLIRVVASTAYGVEALGFGDVTLMAMIGAFFGWQAGLICFFIAPFTGLGIVIAKWLMTGNREVAFGPFICAGACIVLFLWQDVWIAWGKFFSGPMAPILLGVLFVCVLLMGIVLGMLRMVRSMAGEEA